MRQPGLPVLLALALVVGATGCGATRRAAVASWNGVTAASDAVLKVDADGRAVFVSHPEWLAEHRERFPFQGAWKRDDAQFDVYGSVWVAPVDTDHLRESSLWDELNLRGWAIQEDARELALEAHAIFVETFREDPAHRFEVVDRPRDDSLVIKLAIVELVPSKEWLALVGLGAWAAPPQFGAPVGVLAAFAQRGYTGLEGMVVEARSGDTLLLFADREANKIRVIDLQSLVWYAHARESLHDWARQLLEILSTPPGHRVEDSHGFSWRPW